MTVVHVVCLALNALVVEDVVAPLLVQAVACDLLPRSLVIELRIADVSCPRSLRDWLCSLCSMRHCAHVIVLGGTLARRAHIAVCAAPLL